MLERYEETHEHAVAQLSNQDTQKCFTAITFLIASLYQLNEHSDYTNAKLDKDQISNMINSLSPKQIINIYDNHNSYGIHWTNSLSKQLNVNQKVESPEPLLYNQGNKRSEYISRLASKPMIPN
ncbi:hypothetical protein KFE69_05830 [bacterium SCSIO 12844]|nr:hypothetical protein KFE69_05830 [bacterium SCSIO 12844]